MNTHQATCGRAIRLRNAASLGRPHGFCGRAIDIGQLMQNSTDVAQKCSAFFTRLPLEMRCKVYSFVLPPHRRLWVRPVSNSLAVDGDGKAVSHRVLEHFPCKTPPSDTTWICPNGATCCFQTGTGFFNHVEVNGVQPDADSLALMQTCKQMYGTVPRSCDMRPTNDARYLETFHLWTFCFDSIETLSAFTGIARNLPVRHLQVVLYPHPKLYRDNQAAEGYSSQRWRKLNAAWEWELRRVDTLCKRVPELGTLLLSMHRPPRFIWIENEKAIAESLRAITAAPKLRIEFL